MKPLDYTRRAYEWARQLNELFWAMINLPPNAEINAAYVYALGKSDRFKVAQPKRKTKSRRQAGRLR